MACKSGFWLSEAAPLPIMLCSVQLRPMDLRVAIIRTVSYVEKHLRKQQQRQAQDPAHAAAADEPDTETSSHGDSPDAMANQPGHPAAPTETGLASNEGFAAAQHSVLSSEAAFLDDVLGDGNAPAAEARFCLAAWGLLSGADHESVQRRMRESLHTMARGVPDGKNHPLVRRLVGLYEIAFGGMEWSEEDSGAAHSHSRSHGHAQHQHAHDGSCKHAH